MQLEEKEYSGARSSGVPRAAVNTAAHVIGFGFGLHSSGSHNHSRNLGAAIRIAVRVAATATQTPIRVRMSWRDHSVRGPSSLVFLSCIRVVSRSIRIGNASVEVTRWMKARA